MLLCVGNLPTRVTRRDLKTHVQDVINTMDGRSLRLGSSITECTLVRLIDSVNGAVEHLGLVGVQPPRLGLRLIERLRKTPMRGAMLTIRRYRHVSFLGADATSATMSDLLGQIAATGQTGRTEGPSPSYRIELVSSTGGARSDLVDVGSETHSGAFAH